MPDAKQTWQDNNALFPVSAARMTNIENRIFSAQTVAEAALVAPTTTPTAGQAVIWNGTAVAWGSIGTGGDTPPNNAGGSNLPTIAGSAVAPAVLTLDPGTWTGSPAPTFTFEFQRST